MIKIVILFATLMHFCQEISILYQLIFFIRGVSTSHWNESPDLHVYIYIFIYQTYLPKMKIYHLQMCTYASVISKLNFNTLQLSFQIVVDQSINNVVIHILGRKASRKKMVEREKCYSSAGNWTPVSHVTGGYTHHYTTEEVIITLDKLR